MTEETTVRVYGCDHSTYDEYDRCVECGAPCQILTVYYEN